VVPGQTTKASHDHRSGRGLPLLAWGLVGAPLLLLVWQLHGVTPQLDDAYISYRYARNLADGHGLVFNPGERVEGITSLLWTLLVAVGIRLGFDGPLVGHALGLTSAAGVLILSARLARRWIATELAWTAWLAPWLILSTTCFPLWSVSGMETPLFALAVTATWLAHARGDRFTTSALCMVATAVRPEGALLAAVALGLPLLTRSREARDRSWSAALAYAVFLTALTAFRLTYYGLPVPNTFYAKVGGVPIWHGLQDLGNFLLAGPGLLLPAAALGIWNIPAARPAALYCLLSGLYVVAVGGDTFPGSRFFVHLLPCLVGFALAGTAVTWQRSRASGLALAALLATSLPWNLLGSGAKWIAWSLAATASAAALAEATSRRARPELRACTLHLAAWIVVGFFCSRSFPLFHHDIPIGVDIPSRDQALRESWQRNDFFGSNGRRFARALLDRSPRPSRIAAIGIGVLGWETNLPMVDLVGLVTPEVARRTPRPSDATVLPGHQRANTAYILSLRPDYIMITQDSELLESYVAAEAEIRRDPRFQRDYAWDPVVNGWRRTVP